jgi:hypothetical protein
MFEIIKNSNLPQLNIHLKVLQSQEKIVNFGQKNLNSNLQCNEGHVSETRDSQLVKFTYSTEWTYIKNDRELIKATQEGFLLHVQLTEKLNLKFQV